uniref:Putative secreted peptide n=1 Tax=Anopheles braziliensis TaxID=58242 RepID=A0A2M3ZUI5_9DIPT
MVLFSVAILACKACLCRNKYSFHRFLTFPLSFLLASCASSFLVEFCHAKESGDHHRDGSKTRRTRCR